MAKPHAFYIFTYYQRYLLHKNSIWLSVENSKSPNCHYLIVHLTNQMIFVRSFVQKANNSIYEKGKDYLNDCNPLIKDYLNHDKVHTVQFYLYIF